MHSIAKNRERLLSVPTVYAGHVCSGLRSARIANVDCLLYQYYNKRFMFDFRTSVTHESLNLKPMISNSY